MKHLIFDENLSPNVRALFEALQNCGAVTMRTVVMMEIANEHVRQLVGEMGKEFLIAEGGKDEPGFVRAVQLQHEDAGAAWACPQCGRTGVQMVKATGVCRSCSLKARKAAPVDEGPVGAGEDGQPQGHSWQAKAKVEKNRQEEAARIDAVVAAAAVDTAGRGAGSSPYPSAERPVLGRKF